jgi:hemin uptake protein HemP
VVDARRAAVDKTTSGQLISGTGATLAVLHAGQSYSLR